MGKQQKKKKGPSYKQGKVVRGGHLPLPISAQVGLSLPVQLFVGMLGTGHFNEFHGIEVTMFVVQVDWMARQKGDREVQAHAQNVMVVLDRMNDRFFVTNKWGTTGDELKHLRGSMPFVVEFFHSRTRGEVARAHQYVESLFDKHKKSDTITSMQSTALEQT